MLFLVDAQLPPALARWLVSEGLEAEHVIDCHLEAADDGIIWEEAIKKKAIIITKDEDFSIRATIATDDIPPIVWLRIGNSSRKELLDWFALMLPKIIKELERGERLIEVQ